MHIDRKCLTHSGKQQWLLATAPHIHVQKTADKLLIVASHQQPQRHRELIDKSETPINQFINDLINLGHSCVSVIVAPFVNSTNIFGSPGQNNQHLHKNAPVIST